MIMFYMFLSIIFAPASSLVLQTGTTIWLMTFNRTLWIKNVSRDQISSVSHVRSREPENVDEMQITREHASRKFDVSTNPQLQV
jgi:hypothetical protein